jgi:hypothetical protein
MPLTNSKETPVDMKEAKEARQALESRLCMTIQKELEEFQVQTGLSVDRFEVKTVKMQFQDGEERILIEAVKVICQV